MRGIGNRLRLYPHVRAAGAPRAIQSHPLVPPTCVTVSVVSCVTVSVVSCVTCVSFLRSQFSAWCLVSLVSCVTRDTARDTIAVDVEDPTSPQVCTHPISPLLSWGRVPLASLQSPRLGALAPFARLRGPRLPAALRHTRAQLGALVRRGPRTVACLPLRGDPLHGHQAASEGQGAQPAEVLASG